MVPATSAKARDLPGFLGHPVQVGQRWSESEAEAFYRLGHLPDFRRSWLTLLSRFLRPWGSNPRMRITAHELRGVAQPTLFIWERATRSALRTTGAPPQRSCRRRDSKSLVLATCHGGMSAMSAPALFENTCGILKWLRGLAS